jgi:hypothetical protein
MCWTGKVEHKYVAKENIEVRKMLLKEREELFDNPSFVSPYQFMKYEIGIGYVTKINPFHAFQQSDPSRITINEGLHCYSPSKCRFVKHENSQGETSVINVYLLCNFKNLAEQVRNTICFPADGYRYPVVMKAIIPKGTTYYENDSGEIVSEKLIVKEIDNKL